MRAFIQHHRLTGTYQRTFLYCLLVILSLFSRFSLALPDWVKSPPQDNEQAIYGIGSGASFEQAKNNALSDIAAKFNANVRESYSAAQRIVNDEISSDIKIDTQVEIEGTRLNHFRVSQSEQEGALYWSLVELDRKAFADDIQQHWFKLDQEMTSLISQIGETPSLLTQPLLQPTLVKMQQLKAVLVQRNFIRPNDDFKRLFQHYNQYQSQLVSLIEGQFVILVADNLDALTVALVKEQLTAKGLKLVDKNADASQPFSTITVTSTLRQNSDDRNAKISQLEVFFNTTANNGEHIGANSFRARGRDYESADAAFAKALAGIQQQIKRLPLTSLLNIHPPG